MEFYYAQRHLLMYVDPEAATTVVHQTWAERLCSKLLYNGNVRFFDIDTQTMRYMPVQEAEMHANRILEGFRVGGSRVIQIANGH